MTDIAFGPGYRDFYPLHGDTFKFSMVFSSDQAIDLTGHTPLFQIRDDADNLIKDWSAYVTIASATQINVSVPASGWANIDRPRSSRIYNHDLQLTAPGTGTVRTVITGKMVITRDVSHG